MGFFYIITRAGVWLADILLRKGCARWKLGGEVTEIFSWLRYVLLWVSVMFSLHGFLLRLSASCKVTLDIEFHLSWWLSELHVLANPYECVQSALLPTTSFQNRKLYLRQLGSRHLQSENYVSMSAINGYLVISMAPNHMKRDTAARDPMISVSNHIVPKLLTNAITNVW